MVATLIRGILFTSGSLFVVGLLGDLGLADLAFRHQTAIQSKAKESGIIFQVGDFVMTTTELAEVVNTHAGGQLLSGEAKLALVDSLLTTKLFALAARTDKLDEDADFKKVREAARERVLIAAYIERHVEPKYSDDAARVYFEAHKDELKDFSFYRWQIVTQLMKETVAATIQSLGRQWKVKELADLKSVNVRSADPFLILAQVGERTVTVGDIQLQTVDSKIEEKKFELFDWLVLERLSLLEAQRIGLAKDPVVRKALAWSDDHVLEIRYAALIQGKTNLVEEARRYYQAHPEECSRPEQLWLRQIVVANLEDARAVKAKLDSGEDFGEVAKRYSTHPATASKGGELGWVGKGRLYPEVEMVAFQLKPKQISEPVKTPEGYQILLVQERSEGALRPFDEIMPYLLVKLQPQAVENERHRLMKVYNVTIRKELL